MSTSLREKQLVIQLSKIMSNDKRWFWERELVDMTQLPLNVIQGILKENKRTFVSMSVHRAGYQWRLTSDGERWLQEDLQKPLITQETVTRKELFELAGIVLESNQKIDRFGDHFVITTQFRLGEDMKFIDVEYAQFPVFAQAKYDEAAIMKVPALAKAFSELPGDIYSLWKQLA